MMFHPNSPYIVKMVNDDGKRQLALFHEGQRLTNLFSIKVEQDWNGMGIATATITVPISDVVEGT